MTDRSTVTLTCRSSSPSPSAAARGGSLHQIGGGEPMMDMGGRHLALR